MTEKLNNIIKEVSDWITEMGLNTQEQLVQSNQVHCSSEELGEFFKNFYKENSSEEEKKTELGDVYVTLIGVCVQKGYNPVVAFEDGESLWNDTTGLNAFFTYSEIPINLVIEMGKIHQGQRKGKSVHQSLINCIRLLDMYGYDIAECLELAHHKNTNRSSRMVNGSLIKKEDE